jgi:hypothetical protein
LSRVAEKQQLQKSNSDSLATVTEKSQLQPSNSCSRATVLQPSNSAKREARSNSSIGEFANWRIANAKKKWRAIAARHHG